MPEISRRSFLRGAGALAAAAVVGPKLLAPGSADATVVPFIPYSADAYFKAPAAGLAIDATRTAAFRAFMAAHPEQKVAYPKINGLPGNAWGTAYAEGRIGHTVWTLTGNVPNDVDQLTTTGFHAPAWLGTVLTDTTDSPFVVMDRGSGFSVWAAKASLVKQASQGSPGIINVGAAGLFEHASNGLDKRNPASDSSVNFRSRGAIPDAMVIRRDLVDQAITNGTGLGHKLHMFLVETLTSDGFCSPMVGCESGKNGFGAEGEMVALDPSIDLTTRGLSPVGLVVARTLQEHGAYFGDNAGSNTSLKAEQASASRNPWAGLDVSQDMLAGLTWDDFVVIER